jgi:hypothetical protein
VGAPSFAQFAKGGSLGYGHQKANTSCACSIATRPFGKLRASSCKERKDGALSVAVLHVNDFEGGPPPFGQTEDNSQLTPSGVGIEKVLFPPNRPESGG